MSVIGAKRAATRQRQQIALLAIDRHHMLPVIGKVHDASGGDEGAAWEGRLIGEELVERAASHAQTPWSPGGVEAAHRAIGEREPQAQPGRADKRAALLVGSWFDVAR